MKDEFLVNSRNVVRLSCCALVILVSSRFVAAAEPEAKSAGLTKFTLSYRSSVTDADETRPCYLWYPTQEDAPKFNYGGQVGFVKRDAEVSPGKHPLILFSHGFLGAADQSVFLTEELARQGYVVASLDHADSLRTKREKRLEIPKFGDPKSWDDTKFRDRREDMVALLEHLLKLNQTEDSFLFEHINETQIGAAGHSLGGYTVFGLVGGWSSWQDRRIRSALLMSPYSAPFLTEGEAAKVEVPVMLQGGTWDFGITPLLPALYDRLNAPRYYVVFKNETHLGWTNLVSLGKTTKDCVADGNPELITRYSISFFDKTLCAEDCPELTAEEPRLDKLKFEKGRGKR